MNALNQLTPCTSCGKCCTYVAVEINSPTTVRYATDILWYLYHERVSVYRDGDGEWCVQFEARCRNLQDNLLCGVYAERPLICRDFDNTTCEVNSPEGEAITFRSPEQFLAYLKKKKPRLYKSVAERYLPPHLRPQPESP